MSYNIAEAVKFVTGSDDEECDDAFENDGEEQIGRDNDLPLSEGETDELTDIEESGDDKHAVTNAKARYFYPRICKCLVKDIDSVLDERN